MWKDPKQVLCLYCDTPTIFLGTGLCDNCWEVVRRLPIMLRTEPGREYVTAALKQALPLPKEVIC